MATHDCLDMINRNREEPLELQHIPFDDKETYDAINKGYLAGIFQLDASAGIRGIVKRMQPQTFEEFSAVAALYRPGPLQSGMTKSYLARKNGQEEVKYVHPLAENALKGTYGVCVYQEQVMQIAQDSRELLRCLWLHTFYYSSYTC